MLNMEFTGKTVQKAIDEGLRVLNKAIDEVDIKIVSQGGLFRKAKIIISALEGKEKNPAKAQPATTEAAAAAEKPRQNDFNKFDKNNGEKIKPKNNPPAPQKPAQNVQNTQQKPAQNTQQKPVQNVQQKPVQNTQQKPAQNVQQKPAQNTQQKPAQNAPKQPQPQPKPERKELREVAPVTREIGEKAKSYLEKLLQHMNVESAVAAKIENDELTLNIESETGAVIGYRGETLDALELLTILSNTRGGHYKITVNSKGYRERRQETLIALAKHKAEKVARTGRREILEPMSSNARRMIHDALSDNDRVTTKSDGNEPNRYIVIYPRGGFNGNRNNNNNNNNYNNNNRRNNFRNKNNFKKPSAPAPSGQNAEAKPEITGE